jgi:acetylornithine deacetylase
MHDTTRLLRDLVSLPSVNPMGRTAPNPDYLEHRVTDYLEQFFRALGVPCERQLVAPQRENIVAHCDLGGRQTVLFEAHQDTVPTDNMAIEPFAARIENGLLYGRGACDVKGGMASMLAAFARLVREKPRGAMNVVMACAVDEEHTFLGVQELVKRGPRADMAIVAEPTSLRIVNAHKGVCRWHVYTQGRSCHSSTPEQGVNAIYRMGGLLTAIERYAEQLRAAHADALLGPATLSVGRIEGGASVNTVPDSCRIEVDRRLIPGEDPERVVLDFTRGVTNYLTSPFPFECSKLWINCPALSPNLSDELTSRLGAAIDRAKRGHQVIAVPYGTDASSLARAGTPSVVFGPGDIAKAHTCDENVALDEVEEASAILHDFVCRA